MIQSDLRRKFITQRDRSKRRRILFRLAFDQWLDIWTASGHLHERGRGKDKYCMARKGDTGPYEAGNVDIVPFSQNVRNGQRGTRKSPETRAKMRAKAIGRRWSEETRAKRRATLRKIDRAKVMELRAKGLSQTTIAAALNCSQTAISFILRADV
jgi:hypothetical protein